LATELCVCEGAEKHTLEKGTIWAGHGQKGKLHGKNVAKTPGGLRGAATTSVSTTKWLLELIKKKYGKVTWAEKPEEKKRGWGTLCRGEKDSRGAR